MMPLLSPLGLAPVYVAKPWGGRRRADRGKALPADELIGESWEVADLTAAEGSGVDDPRSRVVGGPFGGSALHELVERLGDDLLGSASPTPDGRFPLLIKFLDAREHLSVQVHPHAAYVAEHPQARLKTESWYVIAAEPGAQLFLDIDDTVTLDDFRAALGSPRSAGMLRRVPATAGDFHHLPAGLVHALGAGVLVAEVQTPSDTTFRIYDWTDEYGRQPRDLHLTEAADTLVTRPDDAVNVARVDRPGVRTLVTTEHYWIREHVSGGGPVALLDAADPRVLLVTRGQVTIGDADAVMGTTMIVPAAIAREIEVSAAADAGLLEVGLTQIESTAPGARRASPLRGV